MSNIEWLKKHGTRIVIKFDKSLIGDVTGKDDAVGGWKPSDIDFAEGKPASAGSVWGSAYEAENAFDGDEGTEWRPAYRTLSWIKVDLEKIRAVAGMAVRRASGGAATQFYVEGSLDDQSWDMVYEQDTSIGTDYDLKVISFGDKYEYRYWRITVTARSGNYPGFSIVQYRQAEPVGNEVAFSILGQEPKWVEYPSEDFGPMMDGEYEAEKVEGYPPEILHTEDLETGIFVDVVMSCDGLILGQQEEGS